MNRTQPNPTLSKGQAATLGSGPLREALRQEVQHLIEQILEEEVTSAIGVGAYQRLQERLGYRHGSKKRRLTTGLGTNEIRVPRARLFQAKARPKEWQSELLPRYERRTREVDEALVGVYLQGVNTRRVKVALRPMLEGAPLSRSTISRVVARTKELLLAWQKRSLAEEPVVYLYLDAICVKVRVAKRVSSVPVLVAVGVREDGSKFLLGLWMRGSESAEAWGSVLEDLVARELRTPLLVVVDGCSGLRSAIEKVWPGIDVQRCTVHKLRNLQAHAPKHAHDEIREDYRRIVYATTEKGAREAYDSFLAKWRKNARGVARSLEEAGEELLTFFRYPKSQWKSVRTTNIIERLNEEFRRRIKTQASLPDEDAVLVLFFGLSISGSIRMRKIHGYRMVKVVLKQRGLEGKDQAA